MSSSGRNRHQVAAFIIGAAIVPATVALAWAWLVLSSPERCSPFVLCLGGLGEALVSGVATALVAGVVAQHLARDASGWLAMMGGLMAAAVVVASGGSVATFGGVVPLLGVPATLGYFVIGGLRELLRGAPRPSADVAGTGDPTADLGRGRNERCESCSAPRAARARSCTTCGSAVLG